MSVDFRHIPLRAWVTFTRCRNGFTQARNGNRANCGEMHHPIVSGLRQKSPMSVTPARKVLVEDCLGVSDRRAQGVTPPWR